MADQAQQFEQLMRDGEYGQALAFAQEAVVAAAEPLAAARANVWWADAARFVDDNETALARAREAERLLAGDAGAAAAPILADAARAAADALRMTGQPEQALAAARQAEAIARRVDYLPGQVDALRLQSWLLLNADQNEEALAAAELSVALARRAAYAAGQAAALDNLADVLLKLERREESLAAAVEAATLCRQLGDRLREANALQSQTNALRELERHEESLATAMRATELYSAVGDRLGQGHSLRAQSDALCTLGRHEQALEQAQQAQALLQQVGSRLGQGSALRAQAEALRALGRAPQAMAAARAAAELFRQIPYRQGEAEALLALALAAAQAGDTPAAEAAGREAETLFAACGMAGMVDYARYLTASLTRGAPTAVGGRAVARLHEEFGAQLGQILADAEKAEEAWHRELRRPRQPACPPGRGELVVLRQWPSYATLSLLPYPDEVAGGYVLRWGDRNLVIDPGLGFLAALRQAGFHLTDIDGVAITHWHIDHTGDVEEMLTSLFEANDPDLVARLDFFLAPGAFSVYANLLAHNPGVRSVTLLRAGEQAPWGRLTITAAPAGHRDLTGRDGNTIGLRLGLEDDDGASACTIGITSDTRWNDNLLEAFAGVDLAVLHLGGIYSRDLSPEQYARNHLGVKGTAELLSGLAHHSHPPRLALLSEIGKELEYERVKLCSILGEVCGCHVFPAELGMRIGLPDLRALCDARGCDRAATRWGTDPHDRKRICVRCDDCLDPFEAQQFPVSDDHA